MFKSTIVLAIAGLLSFGCAQDGLPDCAHQCLTPYISGSSIAGCSSLDVACICSNPSFLSGIACCLSTSCNDQDKITATNFALNLCKANGVSNLPTTISCASTASSTATTTAGASTSASSSATTTASGASVTSTSSTAGATAAATSVPSTAFAAPTKMAGMWELMGGLAAAAVLL